jgi:DNA (cytosine-5)-methyltransferase 1
MSGELIIDSFAGGGGTSAGIEMALGRSPDIAINHDAVALAMHAANHPATRHLPHDIWKVDPLEACGGRPVGLLWASPDCKHFSKAKGGRPVEQNIRDLAWVVIRWARVVKPRVIVLENVEEFTTWGPLAEDGRPCPRRSGQTFARWVAQLRGYGYRVEHRELCAADYGAPTMRRRLFLIARRDGAPIIWPKPSHAKPGSPAITADKLKALNLKPWRAAAEIIDWSLPCPSIFDTSAEIMARYGIRAIRPLAENTLARIARGVRRYVLEAAEPFIVPITHAGDERVHGLAEPLRTVTTAHRGEHALIAPFIARTDMQSSNAGCAYPIDDPLRTVTSSGGHAVAAVLCSHYGEGEGGLVRSASPEEPLRTVTASPRHSLVTTFLAQHNSDMVGHDAREPVSTIVQKGCTQAVVSAGIVNLRGTSPDQFTPRSIEAPVPTVSAGGVHAAEVRAFLIKYYGAEQDPRLDEPLHTATTRHRFGLVTVNIGGEPYAIVDIGMRMLTPRELFRAQGFPNDYQIERGADGRAISKTDQIRCCGNSVCPPVAAALVAANCSDLALALEAAE